MDCRNLSRFLTNVRGVRGRRLPRVVPKRVAVAGLLQCGRVVPSGSFRLVSVVSVGFCRLARSTLRTSRGHGSRRKRELPSPEPSVQPKPERRAQANL